MLKSNEASLELDVVITLLMENQSNKSIQYRAGSLLQSKKDILRILSQARKFQQERYNKCHSESMDCMFLRHSLCTQMLQQMNKTWGGGGDKAQENG